VGRLASRWLSDRPLPLARLLLFIPWHLWQILISNLRVAKLVLTPGLPIKPRLLRRPPGSSDNRALTLLGCAITLTPGTLTVDINERYMIVHALDDGSYEDMQKNVMTDRVGAVFRGVGS
jgi:multicomponent Na+:H+ antiporter subunit E